jgi:hypothetical protein
MYCVYLTIYSGNLLPPFYIGSTKLSKIEKGYNGTVCSKQYQSIWRSERQHHRHLFKTIVLSTFDNHSDALLKEANLQKMLNVVENPLYINKSLANTKFKENRTGKKHSRSTRLKISKERKGKYTGYRDPAVGKAISLALSGHEVSNKTRQKLRQFNLGKKHPGRKRPPPMSEEQKKKISESVRIARQRKRCKPEVV